jgi:hypothetical protein
MTPDPVDPLDPVDPVDPLMNSKNADIAVKTEVFVTFAPSGTVPRALDPFSGAKLIESR